MSKVSITHPRVGTLIADESVMACRAEQPGDLKPLTIEDCCRMELAAAVPGAVILLPADREDGGGSPFVWDFIPADESIRALRMSEEDQARLHYAESEEEYSAVLRDIFSAAGISPEGLVP